MAITCANVSETHGIEGSRIAVVPYLDLLDPMIVAIRCHDKRRRNEHRKTNRNRRPTTQEERPHRLFLLDDFYPGSLSHSCPGRVRLYAYAEICQARVDLGV
jgi:hypothetical protein